MVQLQVQAFLLCQETHACAIGGQEHQPVPRIRTRWPPPLIVCNRAPPPQLQSPPPQPSQNIFTPSASGLDLLAAAATATNPHSLTPLPTPVVPPILASGLYNPAAFLPPKVIKKTLDLYFVEMYEIFLDKPPQATSRLPLPTRPPVRHLPMDGAILNNGSVTGYTLSRKGS